MNRLLLRLYLGSLLSMVAALGLTLWLGWDNLERSLITQATRLLQAHMHRVGEDLAAGESPEALSGELGYPVILQAVADGDLRPAPQERLLAGEVVIQVRERQFWALVRVPDSHRIARIGPLGFMRPERGGRGLIAAFSVLLLSLVGAMALGWPLGRQLLQLSAAADRLGGGDLTARAPVLRGDAAGRLAERFNAMAARIEQLIADQEELMRAISHDLRTPMSRMRFSLELLDAASSPDEIARHHTRLQGDLDAMASMLDELLLYVRLRGRPPLRPRPLSLRELLADFRDDLTLLAPQLTITLTEGPAVCIQGEPPRLRRALENIGTNAVRFARSAVTIRWSAAADTVTIRIEDDGPGIPTDQLARVFEPFVRLEGARTLNETGSGLGLAIVGQIIAHHGGSVRAEGAVLGGAAVVITLPAEVQ